MAKKTTPIVNAPALNIRYSMFQDEIILSGLGREIGPYAFYVWCTIKTHVDYSTGKGWPGFRRLKALTGYANDTIQASIEALEREHLLRVTKAGQRNVYVARERMAMRYGDLLVCTVVADYIPERLRDTLAGAKKALEGRATAAEAASALTLVEIIPGPGFRFDSGTGRVKRDVETSVIVGKCLPGGDLAEKIDAAPRVSKHRAPVDK